MPLRIRPADQTDANTLMTLRTEAESWLAAAGVDQWRDPATRGPALAKWRQNIEAGRTWVVTGEASPAVLATVTLDGADRDFWREQDNPDSALYVAKLITSRTAGGQHLGGRILDWVGAAARAADRPWVRLDCWRSNTKLQAFYLAEGFTHVRTEAPPHRLSGWMGQRPSWVVKHPDGLLVTDGPLPPPQG
ncbi:GNAT family N-acetyltransferase [Streptomyces globisporus]|uniref:GNAT family N-acetyltransferase n=1 Tax=Streptomyces globisporus TaxID=1908 RepID=A0A927BLK0_STRGL|nr:GNAT family N-acetyltransferase [Streptomyces globisporus]